MGGPSQLQEFLGGFGTGAMKGAMSQQAAEAARTEREAQAAANREMRLEMLRMQMNDPLKVARISALEREGRRKDALSSAMANWYNRRQSSPGGSRGADPRKIALEAEKAARVVAEKAAGMSKGQPINTLDREKAEDYENTYHQFMALALGPEYVPKPLFGYSTTPTWGGLSSQEKIDVLEPGGQAIPKSGTKIPNASDF